MPQIRGWVGRVEGEGWWVNDALRQVTKLCVQWSRQMAMYSSPDHTTRKADVEWNSLRPQATLLMHPSGPKGSEALGVEPEQYGSLLIPVIKPDYQPTSVYR